MAPDRRILFEAAYGALMIRHAPSQPARRPAAPVAEQSPNSLSSNSLADAAEPATRVRS
jgi:hypothetical protein